MNEIQRELCAQIVSVGRRMHAQGYVASNDGNISALSGENEILITPSGVSKGSLREDGLLRVGFAGERLEGCAAPSMETPMHLQVYRASPAVRAVVHAHPYHATLCSILGLALELPVLAEAVLGVGPIPLAPFALPGSRELAESVTPFVGAYRGCLLGNHGVITWGESVEKAFYQLEQIEFYARITLGVLQQDRPPRLLNEEQLRGLRQIGENLKKV